MNNLNIADMKEIKKRVKQIRNNMIEELDELSGLLQQASELGEDTCFDTMEFDNYILPHLKIRVIGEDSGYVGYDKGLDYVVDQLDEAINEMENMVE